MVRATFLTTLLLALVSAALSQPAEDYSSLKALFPDQPAVYTQRSEVVEIFNSEKEGVSMRVEDHDELFILADDALPFAPGMEYFNSTYAIEKIKAYTMIPSGKKYKTMEVKDFKKTTEMSNSVFFDDQQAYKYTYPAVCKGARLVEETTYRTTKPEYPIGYHFGLSLPAAKVSLTVVFPESVKIYYKMFGDDTTMVHLTKTKKGKTWTYAWNASNVKNYTSESNAPSSHYYLPHILINIASYTTNSGTVPVIGSLTDLYHWNYSRIKGVNSIIKPEIKALADSITSGVDNEQTKVALIYRWVQKNIRYVAIEDGDNGYVPREAALVLQRRYGDCKDKTSLLQALISAIGADVSFAWIGTRSLPYKYSEFPSTNVDNHMIAVYRNPQGEVFFLDGTTRYHSMGLNPSEIQGKECLVARGPDKFDLLVVPVSSLENNAIIDSVWTEIRHDTLVGRGSSYLVGEAKTDLIAAFVNAEVKDYPKVLARYLPKATNKFNITGIKVSNLDRIEDTLKVTYAFSFPSYISLRSDNYYVNLNLDRIFQDVTIKPKRDIPIEVEYPSKRTFVCTLSIPTGCGQPMLPNASNFNGEAFNFYLSYKLENNCVVLSKQVSMSTLLLQPNSFDLYRKFLGNLNSAYMQTIVLRKN